MDVWLNIKKILFLFEFIFFIYPKTSLEFPKIGDILTLQHKDFLITLFKFILIEKNFQYPIKT